MGKRLAYIRRAARAILFSRWTLSGIALIVCVVAALTGHQRWRAHSVLARDTPAASESIPGLAGEIAAAYKTYEFDRQLAVIRRLAVAPLDEQIEVLKNLRRAAIFRYEPAMRAVVGLDAEGIISQRIAREFILQAAQEGSATYFLARYLHPSAQALVAKDYATTLQVDGKKPSGLDLTLVRHFPQSEISETGLRMLRQLQETPNRDVSVEHIEELRWLSKLAQKDTLGTWSRWITEQLANCKDADCAGRLAHALAMFPERASPAELDTGVELVLEWLEKETKAEDFEFIADAGARLFSSNADACSKLGSLIADRMRQTQDDILMSHLAEKMVICSECALEQDINSACEQLTESDFMTLHHLARKATPDKVLEWILRLNDSIQSHYEIKGYCDDCTRLTSLAFACPSQSAGSVGASILDYLRSAKDSQQAALRLQLPVEILASVATAAANEEILEALVRYLNTVPDLRDLSQWVRVVKGIAQATPEVSLLPFADYLQRRAALISPEDLPALILALGALPENFPKLNMEPIGEQIMLRLLSETRICHGGDPSDSLDWASLPGLFRHCSQNKLGDWGASTLAHLLMASDDAKRMHQHLLTAMVPFARDEDIRFWAEVIQEEESSGQVSDRIVVLGWLAGSSNLVDLNAVAEMCISTGDEHELWLLCKGTNVSQEMKTTWWKAILKSSGGAKLQTPRNSWIYLWLATRPPVESEAERSAQAQECLEMLRHPLLEGTDRDRVLQHLGRLAGENFEDDFGFPADTSGAWPIKRHEDWKALAWATSPAGRALNLRLEGRWDGRPLFGD